jgi:hypothetical protein
VAIEDPPSGGVARGLWLRWVFLSYTSGLLGLIAGWGVLMAALHLGGHDLQPAVDGARGGAGPGPWFLLQSVVGTASWTTAAGVAQAFVLRGELGGFPVRGWIALTTIAAAAAAAAAVAIWGGQELATTPREVRALEGLVVGSAQWVFLRRRLDRAWIWILAMTGTFALGLWLAWPVVGGGVLALFLLQPEESR